MFFLGWHEIRQTLFESLPEGVVEFGKKFDRYSDQGDAGVHVHFKVCTHRALACKSDITCSAQNEHDSVSLWRTAHFIEWNDGLPEHLLRLAGWRQGSSKGPDRGRRLLLWRQSSDAG